jgi:hypothetical protein
MSTVFARYDHDDVVPAGVSGGASKVQSDFASERETRLLAQVGQFVPHGLRVTPHGSADWRLVLRHDGFAELRIIGSRGGGNWSRRHERRQSGNHEERAHEWEIF